MKTLFIPVISKSSINEKKIKSLSKKLPKNIDIAYSIQFKDNAKKISKILSKSHKISKTIQVLGCSKPKFSKDAILLIGSGKFHAISLSIQTKKQVYLLEDNKLIKISKKEIKDFETKQKASYVKFLNARQVGVLISTKPGQQKLDNALKFKIKGKDVYYFISNNIDTKEFENFGLESWINTACPRMDMNNLDIINIDKIKP